MKYDQLRYQSKSKKCAMKISAKMETWRYTLPPHRTKRRATNLKTKNNQNCQKIKLYGCPTTKELKRKHSSRLVGAATRAERTHGKAVDGGPGWVRWQLADLSNPHLHADKLGGKLGHKTDHTTQGSSAGK